MHSAIRPAALLALVLAAALPGPARAATIGVTINGTPVLFDQPPIAAAGRVLVPLRGIFERLGATVVYANGAINATAGARTVSLRIGSPAALVNGVQQTLDVPAQVVGVRAMVPLRFIATALGAAVAYDGATRTVAIAAAAPAPMVASAQPSPFALRVLDLKPAADAHSAAKRPTIAGRFERPVTADSVHIALDDRDVTAQSYISDAAFTFDPPYDVPAGKHTVNVSGAARGGGRFTFSWSFTHSPEGAGHVALGHIYPVENSRVASLFTFGGQTNPGAAVHVTVIAFSYQNGFRVNNAPARYDAVADAGGYFSVPVAAGGFANVQIDVELAITTADGSATLQRNFRYHT